MYQQLKDHFKSYTSAPEEQYDALCSLFTYKSVKKGEMLLDFGEICDFEAFIVKGLFKVFHLDRDNNEWILVFTAENWWVTEFDSYDYQTPSRLGIQALEDSEILCISKADKERAFQEIPVLHDIVRITIKEAYAILRRRVLDKISKTAEERYEDFVNEFPNLTQRLTNREIAKYLGVTPVFVSNIRNKISKKSQ